MKQDKKQIANSKWQIAGLFFNLLKLFLLFTICYSLFTFSVFAQQTVLKAGVSIDKIPKEFYGTWRVTSKLLTANSDTLFKNSSVDLWNLSRANNVITLENPFSGAKASISVDEINGKQIKFKKIGDYDNKKLTDVVELTLSKETFIGVNKLKLDTISEIDGHVIKSETATYKLSGEKISGTNVIKE